MLTRQGKNWGYTTGFFRNAVVSAYHLEIRKGGYCSEHKHRHKYNLFYVLSGKLKIKIWREAEGYPSMPNIVDVTILERGQISAVPPGFYHKFEALEDTECIEVYQVLLTEPDIERRKPGGKK